MEHASHRTPDSSRRTARHPRTLPGLAAVLAALAFAPPAGAVRTPDGPLPDFDAAGGLRIGLPAGSAPSAAQLSAIQALERASGAAPRIVFNGLSRAPRSLAARRPLSSPSSEPPEAVARGFLRSHRRLWGFSPEEIEALRMSAQYTDRHSGVTHLFFTQTSDGLPVFPGVLGVHLDARGRILGVNGDVFPGARGGAEPRIDPERAAQIGAASVGVAYRGRRVAEAGGSVVLEAGPFLSAVRVSRVVYPLLGPPRAAYRMVLEKNSLEWYDLILDAVDGQVLHRRNLYQFTLSPSAPAEADPAAPRGLIFAEHPLATVRGTSDLSRRYPFTDDPTGRPRGFASAPLFGADAAPVVPHGGDPANAAIEQTALPLPHFGSPLRSSALPLSTSPQSPQGWFTLQSGAYLTLGNNVDAKDDHEADNEGSTGMRADGGTTGDFSGGSFIFQNHYGQNGPYSGTAARLAGAAPDLPAVVTNLFYLTNWYHDFLYHLGFTEVAGNFQEDNYGRGGAGNDRLLADAQDGGGTNNANFGTPPDGASPRMQMFLFTAPERDGSLDADVVLHEFTHGLSNRLVGGPNNTDCLGVGLVGEGGSMGEGWSDWYAAVVADEPAVGEYVFDDPASGIRRFPMDSGPSDFSYGFLCTGPPSNPSIVPCEVHDGGEFWSIVLWEMREAMINRFHNRAFPGTPFPTFTGDFPEGNIRNAQGRTADGSGSPARIDRVSIENASFTALFRVTDAMKLAPCNPTMVDMRDAILAADRTAGGEFQDLIWRAFANRGVGEIATSSGGESPVIVEDFVVPPAVEECEAAGGPLPAPSFTVTSTAPNTATVTITPNGAAEYIVTRSVAGPGSPVEPTPYEEVGRTSGTSFTDVDLNGGTAYYYRVRAARNDDCVSAGSVVGVVPTGGPLPCAVAPTFAGAARVIDPGDCEHLLLDWTSAASNCVGGPQVRYNVYRGTTPSFVPGLGNLVVSGVTGNTYADAPGALDALFYYVVRAEDSTSGHGGPANGGNEDGNVVRRAGLVTSAVLVNQGFSDDVESGPDGGRSTHFTSSGLTVPTTPERGGWFRDSDPSPAAARSPVTVWHTFDPDNQVFSPTSSRVYDLTSDAITITPSSVLTFFHTFQTESGFDGGVVEYALVDATTGTVGAFEDLGDLTYENGYNGVLDATSFGVNTNPLFGRRAYTGGVLGPMKRVRAFLGGLVPPDESTQQIFIRFLFGNDVANSADPSPTGAFLRGWYIDDVSIDEPCCPLSPAPRNLRAAATGESAITLTWDAPLGPEVSHYVVLRELVGGVVPSVFTDPIASVPGDVTTFVDRSVAGGVTYAYVVQSVPTSGCPSGSSDVAAATAIGACRLDPTFSGLRALAAPPDATCGLELSWDAALPNCPGATPRYNVYRGIDPSFTPSLAGAVALGVTGTSYMDSDDLEPGTIYTYVVRAEDATRSGDGPANGGNEDGNLNRLSRSPAGPLAPRPDFSDDVEPDAEPGYTTFSTRAAGGWEVTSDATASSPGNAWVALDDQPGAPTLTPKDDRLTLPPLGLTASSVMTFFHNFDFARFPASGTATRHHSGGVLEISADGDAWTDLGPYLTAGGYNGTVAAMAQSPLKGRMAWVGSSDGNFAAGRGDPMQQVTADLGAAIQAIFGQQVLHDARVRFRLGGTFQILIGGIQGSGWGVDDIAVTALLAPSACSAQARPRCAIGGVSPPAVLRGGTAGLAIEGTGFLSGSQAVFGKDGSSQDGVTEGEATVDGAGARITLEAVVDADAPEGFHDLTVVAPDGSFCVLSAAVEVLDADGAPAAGEVPDGDAEGETPLTVAHAGSDVTLSWGASCAASDTDYAVYEGALGDFTSHGPRLCSTGGATTVTLTPAAGGAYYLVVPRNAVTEGSYGRDSAGVERPQSVGACLARKIMACP